jgi:hypothetical protein
MFRAENFPVGGGNAGRAVTSFAGDKGINQDQLSFALFHPKPS